MRYLLLLLPLLLFAKMLEVGDCIASKTLEDQFGNRFTVGSETVWIVTWDKMTTRHANSYFSKESSLLDQNIIRMIVDVSQTPSGIMSLFVMPRMQSYHHTILLSYDEAYNRALPYKEGYITVLSLDDGMIISIDFAADEAQLEELLTEH